MESDLIPDNLSQTYKDLDGSIHRPSKESFKGGYNDLLKFVIPAPYQAGAGSCLFMSHTGVLEWWMGKLSGKKRDLSERYFMNLQKAGIGDDLISNWRTDTIYRMNKTRKTFLNKRFRFTKDWYAVKGGVRIPSTESTEGSKYGVKYNWIVELDTLLKQPVVKVPKFSRNIIFADPAENQWNVGTAPKDIVKKMKAALKNNKAPLIVIYNHTNYWHATMVVGYNDNASSEGCSFVSSYEEKMNLRADEIVEEAHETESPKEKKKLLKKAANFRKRGKKVNKSYLDNGGCKGKGVFYVRDSIYPDKSMPLYDYNLDSSGEEEHLNAKVILREYEWAEQLANHVVQPLAE